MKPIFSMILGVLLTALASQDAAAQWNVARYETHPNRVYTTFGLDPAFVSSLGYGCVIPVMGHRFQLVGEAGIATAHLDANDYRVRLGAHTSIVRWRSIHLTGRATFNTRGTKNVIYRGFNFGADFTGAVGVYRPRWFAAAEFGKDKAVITHVTHSNFYRTYYYADAKDGWYLNAGGSYHYGLVGGVAVGPAEVVGRFGFHQTERFNAMAPPMYASLGVGYSF